MGERAECQTELKALEKSIVARIVREPDLGLLNPSILTKKEQNFSDRRPSRVEIGLAGRENGDGIQREE